MQELDDITIKQAAKGNRRAFRKLYDHYSPFVWKVVYRTVNGNQSNAEVITQNIFVKVHSALNTFKFKASFSTWLYRIIYTESMTYLNKIKKVNERLVVYDESIGNGEKGEPYENKDMVSAILRALSPTERFLLIAREVNDIPFEQLVEITGKSSGSLRTMLHRIKENIRKGFDYETGRVLSKAV